MLDEAAAADVDTSGGEVDVTMEDEDAEFDWQYNPLADVADELNEEQEFKTTPFMRYGSFSSYYL